MQCRESRRLLTPESTTSHSYGIRLLFFPTKVWLQSKSVAALHRSCDRYSPISSQLKIRSNCWNCACFLVYYNCSVAIRTILFTSTLKLISCSFAPATCIRTMQTDLLIRRRDVSRLSEMSTLKDLGLTPPLRLFWQQAVLPKSNKHQNWYRKL